MESDSNDKLRREIAQLTYLISSNNTGRTTNTVTSTAPQRAMAIPIHTSNRFYRPRPRPSICIPSVEYGTYRTPSMVNGRSSIINVPIPQYPNPFRYSVVQGYPEKVFPISNGEYALRTGSDSFEYQNVPGHSRSQSPYSFHRTQHTTMSIVTPTNSSSSFAYVKLQSEMQYSSGESRSGIATAGVNLPSSSGSIPTSVYINPLKFLNTDQNQGPASSSASVRVRPHLNPAFQKISAMGNQNHAANQTVQDMKLLSAMYPQTHQASNGIVPVSSAQLSCYPTESSLPLQPRSSVKNKYKLDRRLKQSPTRRKPSPTKYSSRRNSVSPTKTKVFKRYSMRLVPSHDVSPTTGRTYYQAHRTKKSIATARTMLHRTPTRSPRSASSSKKISPMKGSKSIVNIDGKRYLRKNNGKTLRRVSLKSSPSPAVVSIEGKPFIKRNGEKSLKRLSDSQHVRVKSLSQNYTSPVRPAGIRCASRVIAKSKHTLSQRTWRKKRFCIFYNRFGVCETRESGKCPYIHDRNQLTICPKFVIGTCTNSECKLSHDMKLGRMMPCQFFNKSKCSRENCPYPHVKSTPSKKSKSPKESAGKKEAKNSGNTKPQATGKQKKEKVSKDDTEGKARYYEEKLNSQPMISIVPRRLPLQLKAELESESESKDSNESVSNVDNFIPFANNCAPVTGEEQVCKSTVPSDTAEASAVMPITTSPTRGLRSRLMSKVSSLRHKVKKTESESSAPAPAPTFLSFK